MFATLPDGYKIYFDTRGSQLDIQADSVDEKPTILFLHGGPGIADHTIYPSFWERLQNVAHLVFIDQRGHGRSAEANNEMGMQKNPKWNLQQWGQDIHDFIENQGLKNVIVAGVSFGGWVAISYATQFPNHAQGLILCDTEAKVDVGARMAAYREIGVKKGKAALGEEAAKVVNALEAEAEAEELAEQYKIKCVPLFSENPYTPGELERMKPNLAVWKQFNANEYHQFDFLPKMKRIEIPALILAGELNPEHPTSSAVETFKAMNPAYAILRIVPGAGNPVYRDKPDETLNFLHQFTIGELKPGAGTEHAFK